MSIRLISITSFAIMFLALAFMPFELSLLICFFVFSLWISLVFVNVMPRIYEGNPKDNKDIYPEEFTSIDDVPVVKIDERC